MLSEHQVVDFWSLRYQENVIEEDQQNKKDLEKKKKKKTWQHGITNEKRNKLIDDGKNTVDNTNKVVSDECKRETRLCLTPTKSQQEPHLTEYSAFRKTFFNDSLHNPQLVSSSNVTCLDIDKDSAYGWYTCGPTWSREKRFCKAKEQQLIGNTRYDTHTKCISHEVHRSLSGTSAMNDRTKRFFKQSASTTASIGPGTYNLQSLWQLPKQKSTSFKPSRRTSSSNGNRVLQLDLPVKSIQPNDTLELSISVSTFPSNLGDKLESMNKDSNLQLDTHRDSTNLKSHRDSTNLKSHQFSKAPRITWFDQTPANNFPRISILSKKQPLYNAVPKFLPGNPVVLSVRKS